MVAIFSQDFHLKKKKGFNDLTVVDSLPHSKDQHPERISDDHTHIHI